MKSKKTLIIISLLCFILIIAALLCVSGLLVQKVYRTIGRMNTDMSLYEIKKFSRYQDSFDTVANGVMRLTDETLQGTDEASYASVTGISSNGFWQIEYFDSLSNRIQTTETVASEEEINAYQKVQEAFLTNGTGYGLLTIKVLPDRVVFIASVPYFVIFMENGEKPDYLIVDRENKEDSYIEKLEEKWYHGTRKKLYEKLYE